MLSRLLRRVPCHAVLLALVALAPRLSSAVEVAVVDPLEPVYDASATEDAAEGPLRLVAPRNGVASAQVVVTGDSADAVRAEVGELVGPGGALPASAVRVRYAALEEGWSFKRPENPKPDWVFNYTDAYHDRLMPAPAPGATVVPVWVTVAVPAETAAGSYTGTLQVADRRIPVELRVADWVCPDPADWTTHVGLVPSPEILALTYGAPFWSDEHWSLIEKELGFMGALGADDLWLHASANVGLGKGLAMLHFTRKDGRLEPDLRVAERYIDLFAQQVGRPEYVIVNVWSGQPDRRRRRGMEVTVFVDGEKENVPRPEDEGGKEVWGPMLEGIHGLVTAKGWPEETILLGLAADSRPLPGTVEAFKEIAPYARWAIWTHGRGDKRPAEFPPGEPVVFSNGMEIAYYAHPYTPRIEGWVRPREGGLHKGKLTPELQGGWNQPRTILSTARNDIHKYAALSQWRNFPNGMMLGYDEIGFADNKGSAGFAFVWLDFWPDPENPGWQPFLHYWSNKMNRHNSPSVIEPGPDGPVPTVRFEMLREGLQETEARVIIERATVEGDLSAPLADEARTVLVEGYNARFKNGEYEGGHAGSSLGNPTSMWGVKPYPEWMDATAALYEMAGKVSAATK